MRYDMSGLSIFHAPLNFFKDVKLVDNVLKGHIIFQSLDELQGRLFWRRQRRHRVAPIQIALLIERTICYEDAHNPSPIYLPLLLLRVIPHDGVVASGAIQPILRTIVRAKVFMHFH